MTSTPSEMIKNFKPNLKSSHIDLMSHHMRVVKQAAELTRAHGTSEANDTADALLSIGGMVGGAMSRMIDAYPNWESEEPPASVQEGEDVNS